MSDYDYIKSKLAFSHAETFTGLAANRDLLLKLPAQSKTFFGAWLSACVKVSDASPASGILSLTEGVSVVGDGVSPITPRCKSRLDTPPSCPVPCFGAPDTPSGGTVIDQAAATALLPGELCHWILKPGTNYLIRLAPTSTPDGTLSFQLSVIPNFDWLYNQKD